MSATKLCTKCGEVKATADFHWRREKGTVGRMSGCKACHAKLLRAWREKNRDRWREIQRRGHAKHRAKRNAASKIWYQKNLIYARRQAREAAAALKDSAYAAYGGYRCACCGEAEPAFLALDHVHNDGYSHRKQIGRVMIYRWLKNNNYPLGMFQVLCYNCNQGKRINGGICPHQQRQAMSA